MLMVIAMLTTVISGVPHLQTTTDPITDAVQTPAGISDGQSHLAIVCDAPKKVTVNIAGSEYLGSEDAGILAGGADVIYRFDHNEPHTSRASLNGKTLILASGENLPFVAYMRGASILFLRVTEYDGNPVDFQVNLAGLTPLSDQVLAAYGFEPDGRRIKYKS